MKALNRCKKDDIQGIEYDSYPRYHRSYYGKWPCEIADDDIEKVIDYDKNFS